MFFIFSFLMVLLHLFDTAKILKTFDLTKKNNISRRNHTLLHIHFPSENLGYPDIERLFFSGCKITNYFRQLVSCGKKIIFPYKMLSVFGGPVCGCFEKGTASVWVAEAVVVSIGILFI